MIIKTSNAYTRTGFLVFVALVSAVLLSGPAYASFFGDTIHTVHVYFDCPNFWDELVANYETETYMMCWVVFDAVDTLDSVGIRLKGFSSYRDHPGNKKPFHLKLDEYIVQDYDGNERLSFNNCFFDPTFIREKLANEIFHGLGVPCPRACWSVVYFNDEYWGFYSTIDPINKQALTRFFGYNDGNLYKGDPRGTLEWLGWDAAPYREAYEKSSNEDVDDWTDLIEFINFINNSNASIFNDEICDRFDVNGFARMWAANTFLVNLDSYHGSGHNYFLYFDSDGIGKYIVYDMNMTFGTFNHYHFSPTELRELPIDWYFDSLPPDFSGRPLAERLFDDYEPFRQLVYCALHELLETTLDTATFNARVTELADMVRPYVYADINKMFSNSNFETNLDFDILFDIGPPPGTTIPGLRDFILDRGIYIAGHIEPCDEVNITGAILINEVMPGNNTVIADEMGEYDDWFELYNPGDTAVDISDWWVTDNITEPRKWSFPPGTIIPPDEYLLVWADNDTEQGDYHTSFSLNTNGEELALSGSDFLGAQLCDSVSWTEMPTDSSWGRYPNGSSTWQICLVATPGAENEWVGIKEKDSELPNKLELSAYPNPFNSACLISVPSVATIEIYDLNGKLVGSLGTPITDNRPPITKYIWQPDESIGSGIYFVRATLGNQEISKRVVYLK